MPPDISKEPTERPDDILPRLALEDLTPDDLALAGFDMEAFSGAAPKGEIITAASGTVWTWWGLVLVLGQAWAIMEPVYAAPWLMVFLQGLAGVAGSLFLLYRMADRDVFREWQAQILPMTWLTAAAGALVLAISGSAPALCVLLAIVFAVMATAGRTRWLLIVAGGWMLTAVLALAVRAPLYHHLLLGTASVLFLLLPGIKLWRQALRQSAMRQFGLL